MTAGVNHIMAPSQLDLQTTLHRLERRHPLHTCPTLQDSDGKPPELPTCADPVTRAMQHHAPRANASQAPPPSSSATSRASPRRAYSAT